MMSDFSCKNFVQGLYLLVLSVHNIESPLNQLSFLSDYQRSKITRISICVSVKYMYICANSLQPCLTLCDHMDCSPPGSSVHGILQARMWSGLPFPPPGDLPNPWIEPTSALVARFFTTSATWEVHAYIYIYIYIGIDRKGLTLHSYGNRRNSACEV